MSGAENNDDVVSHQMTHSIVTTAAAVLQPTQTRNRQHERRELWRVYMDSVAVLPWSSCLDTSVNDSVWRHHRVSWKSWKRS